MPHHPKRVYNHVLNFPSWSEALPHSPTLKVCLYTLLSNLHFLLLLFSLFKIWSARVFWTCFNYCNQCFVAGWVDYFRKGHKNVMALNQLAWLLQFPDRVRGQKDNTDKRLIPLLPRWWSCYCKRKIVCTHNTYLCRKNITLAFCISYITTQICSYNNGGSNIFLYGLCVGNKHIIYCTFFPHRKHHLFCNLHILYLHFNSSTCLHYI